MREFSHSSMMDTLLYKQPLTIEHVEQWHLVWCWQLLHCYIMDRVSFFLCNILKWAVNSNTITSQLWNLAFLWVKGGWEGMGGGGEAPIFRVWCQNFINHQFYVLNLFLRNWACRSFRKARKRKLNMNSLYKVYKIVIFNPGYLLNERTF